MITRQKQPARTPAILSLLPREDVEHGRATEATMAKRQVAVYMWPDSKVGEGPCVYTMEPERETLDMSHVQWDRGAHPVFHAGTYRVVFLDGQTPDMPCILAPERLAGRSVIFVRTAAPGTL
jgi:hypothetical protein